MKYFLTFICLLFSTVAAFAQEQTSISKSVEIFPLKTIATDIPTTESVEKLLTLLSADRVSSQTLTEIDNLVQTTIDAQFKGQVLNPNAQKIADETKKDIHEQFENTIRWETVRPIYVDAYTEKYSQLQIDELIAFFESATGAYFVTSIPDIELNTATALQLKLDPLIKQLKVSLLASIKKIREANK